MKLLLFCYIIGVAIIFIDAQITLDEEITFATDSTITDISDTSEVQDEDSTTVEIITDETESSTTESLEFTTLSIEPTTISVQEEDSTTVEIITDQTESSTTESSEFTLSIEPTTISVQEEDSSAIEQTTEVTESSMVESSPTEEYLTTSVEQTTTTIIETTTTFSRTPATPPSGTRPITTTTTVSTTTISDEITTDFTSTLTDEETSEDSTSTSPAPPPSCYNRKRIVCEDPCRSPKFTICHNDFARPHEYSCPASAKYCIDNENLDDDCVSDPGTKCNLPPAPPFICTAPGLYPSHLDCSTYHYCQPIRQNGVLVNLILHEARCVNPTPVFNPDVFGQCERLNILNRNCAQIVCGPNSNGLIRKARNLKRHYYMCSDSVPIMFQCPENMEVDEEKSGLFPCSYNCRFYRQVFADDNDRGVYYECFCVGSLDRCRPRRWECPRYFVYDIRVRRCILPRSIDPFLSSEESNESK